MACEHDAEEGECIPCVRALLWNRAQDEGACPLCRASYLVGEQTGPMLLHVDTCPVAAVMGEIRNFKTVPRDR